MSLGRELGGGRCLRKILSAVRKGLWISSKMFDWFFEFFLVYDNYERVRKNFTHRKGKYLSSQERMKIPFKRKGNRVRQASLSRWLKLQRQSNWGNRTRAEAPHVSFYLTLSRLMRFTGWNETYPPASTILSVFLIIILSPVNLWTIANDYPKNAVIINLTERLKTEGANFEMYRIFFRFFFFLFFLFFFLSFHSHFKPRLKLISLRNCNYWKGEERFPSRECGYILRDVLQLLNRDRSCFELLEKKIERIAVREYVTLFLFWYIMIFNEWNICTLFHWSHAY